METNNVTIGVRIDGCCPSDYDVIDGSYDDDNDRYFIRLKLKTKYSKTAPSQLLARAAVYMAINKNENCPVSLEPLSSYTNFCVGGCGHVFSESVKDIKNCPLCRQKVKWAHVSTSS
jgi:hypothetical protein